MSEILLLTDYYLPHAGGSRVYYHNLYSRLAGPDRVTVVTGRVPGAEDFDAVHSRECFRIVRRSTPLPDLKFKNLWRLAIPLSEAWWRSFRGKADILHAGDFYPAGAVALFLKRTARLPFIAYCHGEDITLTEARRFQRPLRNEIYRRADAVVAACEFARHKLLELGIPEHKITKITPGVDVERFRPLPVDVELARRTGLDGKRVLLTVARLAPRKGHAMVLRAIARLIKRVPDLAYAIAGTGPERTSLEQMVADLGIGDHVRFLGYVPDDQLHSYYNLCDAFVMVNTELEGDIEGFGMVFLEASATGKPVVGGKSGGTADSIKDGVNGYLVDPLDLDSLTDTLERLLGDSHLSRRLGEAGRKRAVSEFDWTSRAQQLRELSSEVSGRHHSPGEAREPRPMQEDDTSTRVAL